MWSFSDTEIQGKPRFISCTKARALARNWCTSLASTNAARLIVRPSRPHRIHRRLLALWCRSGTKPRIVRHTTSPAAAIVWQYRPMKTPPW